MGSLLAHTFSSVVLVSLWAPGVAFPFTTSGEHSEELGAHLAELLLAGEDDTAWEFSGRLMLDGAAFSSDDLEQAAGVSFENGTEVRRARMAVKG